MTAVGYDSDLGYNFQVNGPVTCSASLFCPEAPISSKDFDRLQCPSGKKYKPQRQSFKLVFILLPSFSQV
jgi:hypothetical protein